MIKNISKAIFMGAIVLLVFKSSTLQAQNKASAKSHIIIPNSDELAIEQLHPYSYSFNMYLISEGQKQTKITA